MKKLMLTLIAAAMIACVGCSEKAESKPESEAVTTSAAEEGKFDIYGAVKNMKICGNDVSLPCTFKELGEGFAYDTPIEDKNANWMFTTFRYNGEDIGVIYLELRDDGKYDESQIVSMTLNSRAEASVNGITSESTIEDIKKAFGEDCVQSDMNIDYGTESDGLLRILMNSVTNTPQNFTIMLPR